MGRNIQDWLVHTPRTIQNAERTEINVGTLCLLFAISLIAGAGCTREGQTEKSPIIAMVNGDSITVEELNDALKSLSPEEGAQIQPQEVEKLKEELLNQLIDKKLLLQEAKRDGIQVSREEMTSVIEQMKGDYTEKEFYRLLKNSGLTPERWKQEVREGLLIDKLIDTTLANRLNISEEEITAYYQKNRVQFEKKEEVRARQIVVATEEEAQNIQQQLLNGVDFVKLAIEKSMSPDKANGGDLGYFTKDQMPEEFDIVFTLKVNAISPVTKSPYGYHIFKVEDKRPPRLQSLEEVRETIYQHLAREREDQLRSKWIKELRSKADIQINSSLLIKQNESNQE
jgi:peptidyl-prolyl cis-trans isomerase C